jgi:hypothetical protein
MYMSRRSRGIPDFSGFYFFRWTFDGFRQWNLLFPEMEGAMGWMKFHTGYL